MGGIRHTNTYAGIIMSDFSIVGGSQKYEAFAIDAANSIGVAVTSGAADTKGSWVELVAVTSFDYDGVELDIRNTAGEKVLIDIGVGAAASEVVIVDNISSGWSNSLRGISNVRIPITVPAGSRVSVRCQADGSSDAIRVTGRGRSSTLGQSVGLGKAVTYGAITATSLGTTIDPGASANTKGAYVELSASTSKDIKKLVLCLQSGNTSTVSAGYLADIAIGAAASEVVIIQDISAYNHATFDGILPNYLEFDVDIPKGTRLSMRGASSSGSAATRSFKAVLIGVV